MNTLSTIIELFTKENQHEFLLYLSKKNRRGDTKNIVLFKLIANGKTERLDEILYGKPSKNAYHALCKRLQDSMIDFIAEQSFAKETSEEMDIFKLLLVSRIFFENKRYKLGFKTLQKAERIALQLDVYSILSEIYHTKIQYHHLQSTTALDDVIAASIKNAKLFQQEQHLNMAYATIKEGLKTNKGAKINQLIVDTFSKFEIQINESLSYKSLFQLVHITTTAARLQSDYFHITPFIMNIYELLLEKEDLAHKHLYYHIEILYMMAQTSFRNKNFTQSQYFTSKMEAEMCKNHRAYFRRFEEKLLLLKGLNYNFTNRPYRAIELLTGYTKESLDISLTLVMIYFQQQQYQNAYNLLKNMHHSNAWYEKKQGWIWVLKKSMMEIMVLIELDKLDLVLTRVQSFHRKFQKQLKLAGEERVLEFIKLITNAYENPSIIKTKAFKEKVEVSFEWKEDGQEDIFVMSFYAWLKSKMQGTNIYQTTLALVGSK